MINDLKFTNALVYFEGFPGDSDGKEPACQCRRSHGSIPWLGRSPGEGNGNPLQYSCLENPMDRGAWPAAVQGIAKESDTTERINNNNPLPHRPWNPLHFLSL